MSDDVDLKALAEKQEAERNALRRAAFLKAHPVEDVVRGVLSASNAAEREASRTRAKRLMPVLVEIGREDDAALIAESLKHHTTPIKTIEDLRTAVASPKVPLPFRIEIPDPEIVAKASTNTSVAEVERRLDEIRMDVMKLNNETDFLEAVRAKLAKKE